MQLLCNNGIMEDFKEIKEEAYKCSKCGLCKAVCPVFLSLKNEMYLPRGRFIILNRFFNQGIALTKKFRKDIDICLNCNACKNFCPSSIDAYKIFTAFKEKRKFSHFFFLFLRIHKLINYFKLNSKKRINLKNDNPKKVIYFQGCINKYIDSSDKIASIKLIEKAGYSISKITDNCCGYPFLSDGDIIKFKKNAEKIISSITKDTDYIICSCDTCFDTLKRIVEYNPEFSYYADKLIRLDEFLKLNKISLKSEENVVYYKPLLRNESCYIPQNVEVINRKGSCSLMENFFMFKHPKLADKMRNSVFYKKEELLNKKIITTCQLSKWGLLLNSKKIKSNSKVLSFSEYFINSCN